MEPIFGFFIYGIAALIVSIVAGKRSGALRGVIYFIVMCIASFISVLIASNVTHGNGLIAGLVAFIPVILGLVSAMSSRTEEGVAVKRGESPSFKKCPFCAEAIRKEAIKCRHCGSDLKAKE